METADEGNTATQTAIEFAARMNRRSPDRLVELMTKDHVFIDSLGSVRSGRGKMGAAWTGYFGMFPDYSVEINSAFSEGEVVVLLGRACATYAPDGNRRPENRWAVPAAWRAVVRDGLVAEWQVYADNAPVVEILNRVNAANQSP
jgi:ketosteroid isomerase-like protein